MSQQTPAKLPKGWTAAFLCEIAETASGGTPSRRRKDFFGGSIPWVKSGELNDATLNATEESLTDLGLESSSAKMFPAGTLCIALYGATVGKLAILGSEAATNQAVCGIFVHPLVNTQYLFYFLLGQRRNLIELGKGGAQPNISQEIVRRTLIPLPPLREQTRIISKIDELMTKLDAGVEELRKAQAQLKRYRQAVLKAAVTGELTREWREAHKDKLEPASELLSRILKERRAVREANQLAKMRAEGKLLPDETWVAKYKEPITFDGTGLSTLPEGWQWTNLDTLLTRIQAGKSFKCEERPPTTNEVGVVKVSSVTWGEFNEQESKTCLNQTRIDKSLFVRRGDLLFSRANTIQLVGAVVLVRKQPVKQLMLSDKILRFHCSVVDPSWLLLALRSNHGRDEIERLATGNQDSMRNIGQDRIKQIRVPLPSRQETNAILNEYERLMSIADHLQKTIDRGLKQTWRLRQTILHSAFSGQLVPQDPNDEPAEVLLERIKTERAKREAEKQAEAKLNRKRLTKSRTKRTERSAA